MLIATNLSTTVKVMLQEISLDATAIYKLVNPNAIRSATVHQIVGGIYFFKNGECFGQAYQISHSYISKGFYKIYPTVSMRDTEISFNFGKRGWMIPPRFVLRQPCSQFVSGATLGPNLWEDLPPEIVVEVFQRLGFRDLVRVSHVCNRFADIIDTCALLTRKELICFHSKATWEECTLGVGLIFTEEYD